MAFDKAISSKIIEDEFGLEGSAYLEKIIQISFDLPHIGNQDRDKFLKSRLAEIWSDEIEIDPEYRDQMLKDVVLPSLKTFRDVNRITNALSLTWPLVEDAVNAVDFLCIETLRMSKPRLYEFIKTNKKRLTGLDQSPSTKEPDKKDKLQAEIKDICGESQFDETPDGIYALFPAAPGGRASANPNKGQLSLWKKHRRICAPDYFDAYFEFSLPACGVPKSKLREIFNEPPCLASLLRYGIKERNENGGTHATELLEEVTLHVSDMGLKKRNEIVKSVVSVHDELDILADDMQDMPWRTYPDLILALVKAAFMDISDIDERSKLTLDSCDGASSGWIISLAKDCILKVDRYNIDKPANEEAARKMFENSTLLTMEHGNQVLHLACTKIEELERSEGLINHPRLSTIIYFWDRFAGHRDKNLASNWFKKQLPEDDSVAKLANALVSWGTSSHAKTSKTTGFVQSGPQYYINTVPISFYHDYSSFRERVEEVRETASKGSTTWKYANRFLEAEQKHF